MTRCIANILLPLLMVALAVTGCNTSGGLENQSALPRAGFYASRSGQTISIDSIAVWGVGSPGDSLLAYGRASSVLMPLRSTSDEATFCFHYLQKSVSDARLNDTLKISYSSTPKFISEECGAMYFHTVTSVTCTTHLIDSVAIKDADVTNFDKETLRIYFRTAEPEEDSSSSTEQ